MGISSLNFNNAPYSSDRRQVNVPVANDRRSGLDRRLIARETNSNLISNELTCDNLPKKEEYKVLPPQPEQISSSLPVEDNNFFMKPSNNQANPLQYSAENLSTPKGFVLSHNHGINGGAGSEFVSRSHLSTKNPFGMNTENGNGDQTNKHKIKENIVMRAAVDCITPIRRIECLPDDVNNGNLVPALGAIGLTLLNLPEDLRDIGTAYHQLGSHIKGVKYEGPYDYMKYQHEFSFFRGTMLEHLVDESKHPKLAEKLISLDRSLLQTSFGNKILSAVNTEFGDPVEVKKFNKETKTWKLAKDINEEQRYAYSFKGKWFGEITARALSRTTLIGTGIFALLELYNITQAAKKGNTISDKAKNATKQTIKSGINIASTTAGIAYGGAIGAKYFKGLGSLVGMGVGAVLGNEISKRMQNIIN